MIESSDNQKELNQANIVDEATFPHQILSVSHLLLWQHVIMLKVYFATQ